VISTVLAIFLAYNHMYSLSCIYMSHWQISCPDTCMFSRCYYLLGNKNGVCPIQPHASIPSRCNLLFRTFPLQWKVKLSINRSVGLQFLICHSAQLGWQTCLLHLTAALSPRGNPWYQFLLGPEWIPGLLNACKNIAWKFPRTLPGIGPGTSHLVA
jgi:hypothetical protein